MSSLSKEQLAELTERINARFAEFDIGLSRVFEWVTPGVVRLVFDVIEEWQCANPLPMAELVSPGIGDTDMMDGYHIGWERGRKAMREELDILEKMNGRVGSHNIDPGIELNVEKYHKPFAGTHPDAPAIHVGGNDQIRADIRDHTAYPSLEDQPNGNDIFAGAHPVAGGPEPEAITPEVTIQCEPDAVEVPPPTPAQLAAIKAHYDAPKPTNGNGHHAELSTATTATLGPEHTVVTPLIPRRPRALAEVDGIDDDTIDRLSRPGARAKKELDEIRAKAAAKARLGEVSREQMIAELKRQAMAGTMPTMDQFDIAKPAVWPKAQMLTKRFDASWTDLAREAGLKLVRR